MPRKKQQNIIRTDYLENWIGFYRAHGHPDKSQALCKVARDTGAPISAEEVDAWTEIHSAHVNYEGMHTLIEKFSPV